MTSAYMAWKDGKMSLHVLTSTVELGTKKIQSNLIKFEKLAIAYYNGQSLDGSKSLADSKARSQYLAPEQTAGYKPEEGEDPDAFEMLLITASGCLAILSTAWPAA
ncbi:hypothetical protein NL676_001069 [Syzygium grande]|nr:hypothetical protein NL676_001069 [Syzygium grande]